MAIPHGHEETGDRPLYPLSGIRVVDFGWVLVGPYCTRVLADMGAEVIKIESRRRLDAMRLSPENVARDPDRDPVFHDVNRNKLSLTLDLTRSESIDLIKRLVTQSDVVVDNFSSGTMRKLGLDYEALRQVNPRIIAISMTAAGQDGPLRHIVAYGATMSGLAGLAGLCGYDEQRVLGEFNYSDPGCAIFGTYAILVALYHAKRTGRGQFIDMAQWETLMTTLGEALIDSSMNGRTMGPRGNHNPAMAPHGLYPCQGEDKWVSIAIGTDAEWQEFCKALGSPAWTAEARFATAEARLANRAALDAQIAGWTGQHTDYEATALLQAAGVAAVPYLDAAARYFDPHFREREIYLEREAEGIGLHWLSNIAWKVSGRPMGGIQRPAPRLGEHNDYVLGEILGLGRDTIARLVSEGIVA